MGQTLPFFVYFVLFNNDFMQNCRLQRVEDKHANQLTTIGLSKNYFVVLSSPSFTYRLF